MPKILIADDSQGYLEIYKKILKDLNLDLIFAKDGADAIKKAWKYKPNLIILDLQMPEMTGAECCRIIKQDPTQKDTPVVIITKHISGKDLDAVYQSGCEEFLAKPFLPEQLINLVKRYIK